MVYQRISIPHFLTLGDSKFRGLSLQRNTIFQDNAVHYHSHTPPRNSNRRMQSPAGPQKTIDSHYQQYRATKYMCSISSPGVMANLSPERPLRGNERCLVNSVPAGDWGASILRRYRTDFSVYNTDPLRYCTYWTLFGASAFALCFYLSANHASLLKMRIVDYPNI